MTKEVGYLLEGIVFAALLSLPFWLLILWVLFV